MTVALFALWGAVVWRFRGGGFGDLTGISLGTQATRALCGLALALPVAWLARDWWLMLIAPGIMIGLICDGWAPFMADGLDGNRFVGLSPFYLLPRALGIPRRSEWVDHIAWLQIGFGCMALPAAALAWRGFAWWWLFMPALAFAPVYAAANAARDRLPRWPAFGTQQCWAELAMGAVIGAALTMAIGA